MECNSRPPAYVQPSERTISSKEQTTKAQPAPETERSTDIIHYEGFIVSYNSQMHIPNWVSYELTSAETTGPYSRNGKEFQQDPKAKVTQADGNDYRNSGWSRGHMAPAADFKWSDNAMIESFYYTNICPQDKDFNNRYWNTLENHIRGWANQFDKIYVVTGPIVGKNVNGTIGYHKVVVPDAFFKAVLAYMNGSWTSIAFVMQNTPNPRPLKDCATTVNNVEEITNMDFFDFLDDSLEEMVESILDYKTWKIY